MTPTAAAPDTAVYDTLRALAFISLRADAMLRKLDAAAFDRADADATAAWLRFGFQRLDDEAPDERNTDATHDAE